MLSTPRGVLNRCYFLQMYICTSDPSLLKFLPCECEQFRNNDSLHRENKCTIMRYWSRLIFFSQFKFFFEKDWRIKRRPHRNQIRFKEDTTKQLNRRNFLSKLVSLICITSSFCITCW